MLVKDIMNSNVKTTGPKTSVKAAAAQMTKFSIGSLIIVKSGRLQGILTERDILSKVVAKAKDAAKTKVEDIMTEDVVVIRPDADIEEASEAMVKHKIKKLPVVFNHNLVGIVTSMDIVTAQPKTLESLAKLLLVPRKKKVVAG